MRILPWIKDYLLPHISRIFSASADSGAFRYSVIALCMAFVAINMWMRMITKTNAATKRTDMLSYPFSVVKHTQFGEYLYTIGNIKEAEREVAIAQQLYMGQRMMSKTPPTVLGAQSTPIDIQQKWNNELDRLNNLYMFWSRIIKAKPDYRDAYLTLASLAHAINMDKEAREYLQQAYTLDPNNQLVAETWSILGISF
ncbi:MAG: hypothetical protein V1917_04755 [Candidatus Gottesmanbacteria bacterium]